MTDSPPFSAELPELKAVAALAGVRPSAMADAFNDPERMFQFLTLDELNRLREAFVRYAILGQQLADALEIYTATAKEVLSNAH